MTKDIGNNKQVRRVISVWNESEIVLMFFSQSFSNVFIFSIINMDFHFDTFLFKIFAPSFEKQSNQLEIFLDLHLLLSEMLYFSTVYIPI